MKNGNCRKYSQTERSIDWNQSEVIEQLIEPAILNNKTLHNNTIRLYGSETCKPLSIEDSNARLSRVALRDFD